MSAKSLRPILPVALALLACAELLPAADNNASSARPGGSTFSDEERSFWAFQPPADPPPPPVRRVDWPRSALDCFILAELESRGIDPAPPADQRTLLRRMTLDLTGLLPTPEEVQAFVEDASPDALERVVDRLLASPRYGERWGRHWLDVARYADSNGMDENLAQANAYRYRDWVVAAFNGDMPYDRFVLEQIAGDLLPDSPGGEADHERLSATGFLSLGPKMLAEDDPQKMEMDIVDEQVDTVGRAFMGLTLGCARCHAHKFDPIPIEDYYSLAGIFKSTATMENFSVVARWLERPLASKEALEARGRIEKVTREKKERIGRVTAALGEKLAAQARGQAGRYFEAAGRILREKALFPELRPLLSGAEQRTASASKAPASTAPGMVLLEAESYIRGNVKRDFTDYGNPIGVIYNRGELPNAAEYDVAVERAGAYQLDLRYAAAQARPVRISINGRPFRSDAAGKTTGSWTPESQTWEAAGIVLLRAGTNTIRLERAEPFPHIDKLLLAPSALAKPEGANGAWGAPARAVTPEELAAEAGLNVEFLKQAVQFLEGTAAGKTGGSAAVPAEALAKAVEDPKGPFRVPSNAAAYFPPEAAAELKSLGDEVESLEKSLPVLPQAMAVAEGKSQNLRVHLRGDFLNLGREVPRQFPRILAGERQTAVAADRSGRLELARWLTAPEHPLTSRVMVNRIWRWLFGEGIVRSTDNFGRLGERPSHPKLLDWLATRFIESGWSVKSLHRRILLSAAYQMSAAWNEKAAALDPENRYLWRRSRKRLEAEAIRDAILQVSGGLDLAMGGSLLSTRDREYVTGTASSNPTLYTSPRRSLYLPVIRSALYDVFQAFDFADPSTLNGDRDATTVAPQALFMMNSELVSAASRVLAERLLGEGGEDAARVRLLFERALSRAPRADETERAVDFLARYGEALAGEGVPPAARPLRAWQALSRSVISSSEFIHVE